MMAVVLGSDCLNPGGVSIHSAVTFIYQFLFFFNLLYVLCPII